MRRTFNNPVRQGFGSPHSRLNRPVARFPAVSSAGRRRTPSGLRLHPRAHRLNESRRRACCISLSCWAAVLVLGAAPALGQSTLTFSANHTGNATVKNGRIQIVEGGASTTFQIALPDNFLTSLKAAHPEAGRTGARFGAALYIIRDSSEVTWDTTSGTTHKDRTAEYTISYNGTEIQPRYSAKSATLPERTWVYIPLTGSPPGSTSSFANVDDFAAASFPISFTIKAESDTTYFEKESIRVRGLFVLAGSQATPTFSTVRWNTDDLTFDLVEGALPDPTGKPTMPANLTATAGQGAVTLTWDAVDTTSSNTNILNDLQITKHQARQSTDGDITDETWTDIPNSAYGGVNAASYTITSLTDGTEYTFQVRAVNACTATTGCGNSDPTTAVGATPNADARARPTGLTASAGHNEVTLTWTDPGDATITFYDYQQKAGSAAFGDWTVIPGSSATTTSYRLTGLKNGTAYVYRIRAGRGADISLASDPVSVTPRSAPPAAPVLTATPRHGSVTLSWPNPFDPGIQRWEYRYKIGAGVYEPWRTARMVSLSECGTNRTRNCAPPYFDTRAATLQFALGGLTNGTPYTFHIQAVNSNGATTSNEASATPVARVPAKPTGLTTEVDIDSPSHSYRHLRWDSVEDGSILRYEFTVDAGRTWSFLAAHPIGDADDRSGTTNHVRLGQNEYISSHIFRVRAVNAVGPGPASEPSAVHDPEVAITRPAQGVAVEWDSTTKKANLVWDATEHDDVRGWSVYFDKIHHGRQAYDWDTFLPVGTTRYEIPATFNAGSQVRLNIAGCINSTDCAREVAGSGYGHILPVGIPGKLSGVSATPGDAQITLAWDDPMDSTITHFEYEVGAYMHGGGASGDNDIPDGDDAGNSPADETSFTITAIYKAIGVPNGTAVTNGELYHIWLRARSSHGRGRWSPVEVMPLAAGVPGAPTGLMTVSGGSGKSLTTWDDPQDPSITGYQQLDRGAKEWQEIAGSNANSTAVDDLILNDSGVLVRAVNANGVGPWTQTEPVHSPTPARPEGLQAAPANGRVTLTWDDPGRGVFIDFYRYTTDGGETWTKIDGSRTTAQGQFTRYTVPDITNGQTYTFAIQAENSTGTSPPSAAVTATPEGGAPAKPTGLSAAPGNAEATLTWDGPHDASITRYQVKQGSANWTDISGSDAGTTSHTVASLTNSTAYTFQIRAVNDHDGDGTDDPGPASDAVTVTPGVAAAPASLVAAAGNAQVTLTWTAPASDNGSAVTGYEYTSNADAATPAWTDIPDSGSNGRADETEYTVTSLVNNTTYAFAVRAENASGEGAATPTRRATPVHPDAPQRPAGFRANPGHELVNLTWARPNIHHPVTSYEYRQSTDGTTWSPDWTAVAGSGAATVDHRVTGLVNGTTYTFELRALKDGTAGPSARGQATPSPVAASQVIDPASSGRQTTPTGDTYTVTQLSPPAGLDWSITVPGATDIDGRAFTLRSLQGTTPETSPRYTFTSTGQEGLDILVQPPLGGQAQVCLEPTPLLRREAGGRPLRVLRYSGTGWTPLPTSTDGGMLCGTTTGFSAFVLGYEAPGSAEPPDTPSGTNAAPEAAQALPPQTVPAGETSEPLDLTPYFNDPDGDPLTYAAVSDDPGVVIADLARGSSRLTLHGVAAGEAVVVVTARDPDGAEASQSMTVTVRAVPTNAAPEAARRLPPRTLLAGATSEPLDLTPYFNDPDGDPLTYTAVSYDPGVAVAEMAEGGSQLTLRAVAPGVASVIVTASDPHGAEVSQPMTVTVRTNAALEAAQPLPTQTLLAGTTSEPLDLTPYFNDPDGDPLAYTAVSDDPAVAVAEVAEGGSRLTVRAVEAGEAVVVVTARDPHGAEASQPMTVTVRTNAPPEAAQPLPGAQTLLAGTTSEPLDLTPYFHDPDGDPLTYTAVSDDLGVGVAEVAEGGSQLTLHAVAGGEAVVVVTARDIYDAEASQPMTLTVRTNAPPEVAQPLPQQTLLAGTTSEPLDLTPYFHDPDGDPLTYTAVSDDLGVGVAEVAEGGSQLTLHAVAGGEAVVVVTARDIYDAEASQPMTLTVRTNAPPEVAQPLPQQTLLAGTTSEPLDLTPYFHDPDGDPLTFAAVSSDPAVATAGVVDGLFTLTAVAAGTVVVTVTARDPHGGEVGQSVIMTVTAVDADWVKAWAARFGRTVTEHVLDGVQERLRAAPRPGFQGTLAGRQLGGMGEESWREWGNRQPGDAAALQQQLDILVGGADDQAGNAALQQASSARDLFTSSAFSLTVGDEDEGEGRGGFGALWGRGVVSNFNGSDGPLSLTGEVATGLLGMDWVSGRLRTGLALGMSRGTGSYRAAVNGGDIESKLSGLFPWGGYQLTDRVSVWTAAGYGAGVVTLTPENGETMTAELGLSMVAAGARSELLKLRHLGGVMLALETDTRLTRTTTGAIAGVEATEASVWQRRLGLEGSRPVTLAGRLSLRPSVEVGMRYDGGDAEAGAGMDLGAGFGFSDSGTGLAVDVHVRTLLVHQAEGFAERGAAFSLSYDPTPSTPLGVTARLAPSWGGQAQSGAAALWGRETMAGLAPGGAAQGRRLNGELGYGLPVGRRFVGTPRVGFSTSEHSRDYRVGYGLGMLQARSLNVDLGVDAHRSESPMQGGANNGVRGQVSLGW